MKKIKQGGMLGHKLRQARKIKIMKIVLGAFLFMLTIGSFTQSTSAGVSSAALFGVASFYRSPEGGEGGGAPADAEKALLEKVKATVKTALEGEGELTKKELKKLSDLLAELKVSMDESKSEETKKEVVRLATELKALKESGFGTELTLKGQINKFIADNKDQIKKIHAAGSGVVELKVVGDMTTGSATNPDGIPELAGVQMAPPTNVNLRTSIVEGLVTTFATSLAAYPYTESVPKDGDYTFLGEGDTKQEIDFKIETRYAQPKKLAAWMKLTEESVNDIPGLQSIAYDYLRKKHDLKKQNGILFGDGQGDNLKGATKYGRTFVAGNMAGAVLQPNFMDVVNAVITDIFTTHNYTDEIPYMANLVMVNPVDFFLELVSAKDGFGNPLYPTASLFNRVTIGGATIIPFEDIPAGKIFVGDMSKYNTTNFVGYTVKIGWVNEDFIKNQFVILGESRLHGFVKKLDEQAFVYDDIATIKAAILTT